MLSNLEQKNIILASGSPRRQELLKGLGISFDIQVKPTDESFPESLKAADIPLYLAKEKAAPFRGELKENDVLITCDTIVWINDQVLNKPTDRDDAIRMIGLLQNQMHTVFTGVAITMKEKQICFYDATNVFFNPLSVEEIAYYIDTCKPYDKAGSYGVQEWMGYVGIKKIEGCFYNVMGLPLNKLYQHLRNI